MARKARKEVAQVSVSAGDSGEALALAVMGAAENVELLGDALGKIEEKLHGIVAKLQAAGQG